MGMLRRQAFWFFEALRGRPTSRVAREMCGTETLGADELRAVSDRRLAAFCERAAREVPYWQRVFAEAGLEPDAIQSAEDLVRLPPLTKRDIREAGADMFHPKGGPFRITETGGSTGQPLQIHESPLRQSVSLAARIRSRRWWGIKPGDPELVLFGGNMERTTRGLLHKIKDELIGSITYPAFGMTEEHLEKLLGRLRSMRPRHVFGYTSALCGFARHLRKRHGRDDAAADCGVEVLFTTSEMLLPADRVLLEETFGARVADGYGSKEAGFVAHECPAGRMHARIDTHIIEIVRDSRPVPDGEPGEILLTYVGDWHWPFLRYQIGDAARWTGESCTCGLQLPVIAMTGGRITDLLVRRDGGLVHGLGAIYPIRETPGVERFLVHQKSLELVEVSLVVESGYPSDGDEKISSRLRDTLGGPEVRIQHVPEIAQLASGKYRVVRSDVSR